MTSSTSIGRQKTTSSSTLSWNGEKMRKKAKMARDNTKHTNYSSFSKVTAIILPLYIRPLDSKEIKICPNSTIKHLVTVGTLPLPHLLLTSPRLPPLVIRQSPNKPHPMT
jgi:hypothetical protein